MDTGNIFLNKMENWSKFIESKWITIRNDWIGFYAILFLLKNSYWKLEDKKGLFNIRCRQIYVLLQTTNMQWINQKVFFSKYRYTINGSFIKKGKN